MTTDTTKLPRLPFDRPAVLDVGPVWTDLRARHPITRALTPAADPAWLVTGYAEARALFNDPRLGRSHREPETAPRISNSGFNGGPVGEFDAEPAFNARLRRVLVPSFSARRMRRLEDGMQQLTDSLLDDMIAAGGAGQVVDLHESLSLPLPIFVICQLLGVPYSDRDHFKDLSERSATMTGDDPFTAIVELLAYAGELADIKRHDPGPDVITDLVHAQRDDPAFTDAELTQVVAGVLFAGHETTVNRISIGALLLLENPEARRRLVDNPASRPRIVEEILRLAAPGELRPGPLRPREHHHRRRRNRRRGRGHHRHARRQPRRGGFPGPRHLRPRPAHRRGPSQLRARRALLHRREPGSNRTQGGADHAVHPLARSPARGRRQSAAPAHRAAHRRSARPASHLVTPTPSHPSRCTGWSRPQEPATVPPARMLDRPKRTHRW